MTTESKATVTLTTATITLPVETTADGSTAAIPAASMPDKPACPVCGAAPRGRPVRDMQEIAPFKDHNGLLWLRWQTHSIHFFCAAHRRPTICYWLSTEHRLSHLVANDGALVERLTIAPPSQ